MPSFDSIYVTYTYNSSRNILCSLFHPCPVMVTIVRSLPPEPVALCTGALGGGMGKGLFSRSMVLVSICGSTVAI